MTRSSILIFLLCALGASPLYAAVYKCKDKQGETIYTDAPCDGEEIKIPELKTYTPVNTRRDRITSKTSKKEQDGYQTVEIVSPKNDATIRSHKGNVDVRVLIKPNLLIGEGHKIAIVLDGQQLSTTGVQTIFRLRNLVRGSHAVQVFIIDDEGKVVRTSNTVNFHIRTESAYGREREIGAPGGGTPSSADDEAEEETGSTRRSGNQGTPSDTRPPGATRAPGVRRPGG